MTPIWTDDPADPCSYCVQWVGVGDSADDAMPYSAPGVIAERMYRYVHDDCDNAVAAYVSGATE